MRNSEYQELIEGIFSKIKDLTAKKGSDYASEGDTLKNFKVVGKRLKIKPSEVAWFFVQVKVARLENLKDKEPRCESVEDTILDLINYIGLYHACKLEEKNVVLGTVDIYPKNFWDPLS